MKGQSTQVPGLKAEGFFISRATSGACRVQLLGEN